MWLNKKGFPLHRKFSYIWRVSVKILLPAAATTSGKHVLPDSPVKRERLIWMHQSQRTQHKHHNRVQFNF